MQRLTRQRGAVLDELKERSSFRSAQQIYDDLLSGGTKISLATVYRSLQALADSGVVDTLHTRQGETLFRWCDDDSHHHHLICGSCGLVVEISPSNIEKWVRDITDEYGFAHGGHSVEIFGTCESCQERT